MRFILLVLVLWGCQVTAPAEKIQEPVVASTPHVDKLFKLPKVIEVPVKKVEVLPEPACLESAVDFWQQVYTNPGTTAFAYNSKTHEIYEISEISWKKRKHEAKQLKRLVLKKEQISSDEVQVQFGAGKSFAQGLENSKKYLPMILHKLREAGMPEDLAFIPLVESSFNPRARSKVGALGMWQIMPGTLKLYTKANKKNLYNPEFATDIALKILKDNYEYLGSWSLAVKAYHSGLGRIFQAKTQLETEDVCKIIQDFDGRGYKTASRNYYLQFLAARRLYNDQNKPVVLKPNFTDFRTVSGR